MSIRVPAQSKSTDLMAQRSAIISLGESGDETAIDALIDLIRCYHTDQHCRILAIEAVEKLTGKDIGSVPDTRCKFVDRFMVRREAEKIKHQAA